MVLAGDLVPAGTTLVTPAQMKYNEKEIKVSENAYFATFLITEGCFLSQEKDL